MSRWAYGILVAAMILWSAMTVVAGWYALRGTGSDAPPVSAEDALPDPQAPGDYNALTGREITTRPDARTEADPAVVAAPTARPGRIEPVPAYALGAGGDTRVRSLDVEGPRPKPSPTPHSKGVVVLDPGHGRGDPGAVAHFGDGSYYTEAESNLTNAEMVRDRLVAMGYDVYLTREGEGRGPGGPLPRQFIVSDLFARVALARAVDADVYLAMHGNGASVRSIAGPETWYCGKHDEAAANERLATVVQQAMMDALREYGYDPPDRGIKEDAAAHHSGGFCQFVVTRETPVPAALLEFLFLSNARDAQVLIDPRAHELLADHVAAALDAFMRERAAAGLSGR